MAFVQLVELCLCMVDDKHVAFTSLDAFPDKMQYVRTPSINQRSTGIIILSIYYIGATQVDFILVNLDG